MDPSCDARLQSALSTDGGNKQADFNDEVTWLEDGAAQFDLEVCSTIETIGSVVSLLSHVGNNVQSLLSAHLDRLTSILDRMQQRNHPRSQTVVNAIQALLYASTDWTTPNPTFESFFLSRDLDYFLRHASAVKFRLSGTIYRLPDVLTLVILKTHKDDPEMCLLNLRSLMRYGITSHYHTVNGTTSRTVKECVAAQLVINFDLHYCRGEVKPSSTVYEIGRLIFSAISPVSRPLLRQQQQSNGQDTCEDRMRQIFADEFMECVGARVPRLQRLCRTWIRTRLHENWTLPDGIRMLDVTAPVKAYLNLEK